MKAIIISDSHGYVGNVKKMLINEGRIDQLIHCGDVLGDAEEIRKMCDCPCVFVAGNCDYYGNQPQEAVFELEGVKVFVTHGHRYNVDYGLENVFYAGVQRDARVIAFGHTHRPCIEQVNNVWVVNPGSISSPRTADRKFTYLVMNIDANKNINFTLKNV